MVTPSIVDGQCGVSAHKKYLKRTMDGDPFSLLIGGGVRFDKKRFGKDIETFKPHAVPVSAPTAGPGPSSTELASRERSSSKRK